jgi:endonuclease-3
VLGHDRTRTLGLNAGGYGRATLPAEPRNCSERNARIDLLCFAIMLLMYRINPARQVAVINHMTAEKKPFNIDEVVRILRKTVKPFRKAMLFELYDEGFTSPFEQLLACMISIRTLDEVSIGCAQRLFELARTPEEMAKVPIAAIDEAIRACSFHEVKARQFHEIAVRVVKEFAGQLPCEEEALLSFKGVGPKCANLVLGIACGQPRIGVDVHVDRVTNRWGYVQTKTPEKTLLALQEILPKKYWVEINRLLVPFGKHICTGRQPKCSMCPILSMCRQVGVTQHR